MQIIQLKSSQFVSLLDFPTFDQLPEQHRNLIIRADALRADMCRYHLDEVLSNVAEKAPIFEQLHLDYLYQLEQIISLHLSEQAVVSFSWSDSYYPTTYVIAKQWHYEQSCVLYNLAVFYFLLGFKNPQIIEMILLLRSSIWALEKLQTALPFVNTSVVNQHSDISVGHVKAFHLCVLGYTYQALHDFTLVSNDLEKEQKALTFILQSLDCFKDNLLQLQSLQQSTFKRLPPLVYDEKFQESKLNFYHTKLQACILYAEVHNVQAVEAARIPHMGFALSYLLLFEKIYKSQYLKLGKTNKNIELLQQKAAKQMAILKQKNAEIYKQEIQSEELLFPKPATNPIVVKGKTPKVYQELLDTQKNQQQNLLEFNQLIAEINQRKSQVQDAYQCLESSVASLYEEFQLQKFIEANDSAQQLSRTCKSLVQQISSMGGWDGAQKQLSEIRKEAQTLGQQVNQIKVMLANEQANDEAAQKQFGVKYKMQPSQKVNSKFTREQESKRFEQ